MADLFGLLVHGQDLVILGLVLVGGLALHAFRILLVVASVDVAVVK